MDFVGSHPERSPIIQRNSRCVVIKSLDRFLHKRRFLIQRNESSINNAIPAIRSLHTLEPGRRYAKPLGKDRIVIGIMDNIGIYQSVTPGTRLVSLELGGVGEFQVRLDACFAEVRLQSHHDIPVSSSLGYNLGLETI